MSQFWPRIASEYKAGAAHQFLLHFNAHDLARDDIYGYLPMLYYLMEQLNTLGCDLVIGYSPSQGIIWPDVNRWKAAQKLLGLLPHEEAWEGKVSDIPPMGEFRPDGTFIPNQVGNTRIRATVGEVSAESEPIQIVTDQILRLEISPREGVITSGKMRQFTLTAYDRSGHAIRVRQAEWRVIGNIGSVTPAGVFTATKVGEGKVRAVVGKVTAESGEITVVPGALAKLKIESPGDRISPGEPHAFELSGEDAYGNRVMVDKAVWEALGEDESQPVRIPINSKVVHWNLHEDKFITGKLPPNEELRTKLDGLLHQEHAKVGLVINFVEKIVPNAELTTLEKEVLLFLDTFQHWAMDLDMRLQKHIVLLVTQNLAEVQPALTRNPDIPVVEIPFPDYDERLTFIEHLMNLPVGEPPENHAQLTSRLTLAADLSKEQLARDTAGLNLFGIHDVALQSEEMRQPITRELVTSYRRESVEIFSRGILEVGSTSSDLEAVGGLDHVVDVIRDVGAAMNEGDLRRVPRGMLFLGIPGTGRLLAAKLLAGHGNMSFVRLKNAREGLGMEYAVPGVEERIYERNLKFAINFIRAITPVVAFIDEIDQAGTVRVDMQPDRFDSVLPVELLNAISDPALHGKVIWIGASNRPDLMDPIFRRSGVFDYKLIFLPPTEAERSEILEMFCKSLPIDVQNIDFGRIAADQYTKGLSTSDLAAIVQRSYNIAKRSNRQAVTEADLTESMTDFVPDYSREMNEFMGLLALREANSRSMIPAVLPPEFREYLEGNRLNKTKINQRLMALRRELGL
jgi:SpoVK/Ycf46/Vps4 family AAA+-type ATPase